MTGQKGKPTMDGSSKTTSSKDELWPARYQLPRLAFLIAATSGVWAGFLQFHDVKGGKKGDVAHMLICLRVLKVRKED